jgi:hypothetical protein
MNKNKGSEVINMNKAQSRVKIALYYYVVVTLSPFIVVSDLHAYIDPGTGSYVFQLVIAGLLAASFGIKAIWMRVINFLRSILRFNARKPHQDE